MNLTRPKFDEEEIELLKKCLESGWVTQGPFTEEFERIFAAKYKFKYALATTSCSSALMMSVLALSLGPGDEVIVPAFTWITSANCAEYAGAKAIFADVELDTYNIDPKAIEAAITPNTRAIVVVHLFGLSAKMDEIMGIARKYNLFVIEDAACAIGTSYNKKPVGGFGDIGCFSFHPRKIITTGEGGMVTTNQHELANRVKILKNHGGSGFLVPDPDHNRPYYMAPFEELGYNLKMSDIQAAVGVAQMAKLDGLLAERKRLAKNYNQLLEGLEEEIALPKVPEKCSHTYQSYVIRLLKGGRERRNRIMDRLADQRIETRPGTHAVHRLGYYRKKYNLRPEMFPNACLAEDTTITLPLFPDMTEEDQDFVVREIREALNVSVHS